MKAEEELVVANLELYISTYIFDIKEYYLKQITDAIIRMGNHVVACQTTGNNDHKKKFNNKIKLF